MVPSDSINKTVYNFLGKTQMEKWSPMNARQDNNRHMLILYIIPLLFDNVEVQEIVCT